MVLVVVVFVVGGFSLIDPNSYDVGYLAGESDAVGRIADKIRKLMYSRSDVEDLALLQED